MRGLTSTIVLVVVLGGLLGYIYFADPKPDTTETKPKAFDLTAENIEEVDVRGTSGQTARLQRAGDTWQLVAPEKAEADKNTVDSITSTVASIEVQRVVEENPTDLKQYGLDPPRIEVGLRLRDQKDLQKLQIGEKTPTGGDLYAKRPDQKRVFLVSGYVDTIFDKSPFDLRDKSILRFDRDKVDHIEITSGARALQFAKIGTEWRIAKPIAGRADFGATEGVLSRLGSTTMTKMVAADGGDLRKYGLDRPAVTVTLGAGSSRATLLLGRTADEGGVFAKDAARPEVFTVEQALLTELQKDLPEYRRKDVFDARSFTANRIELRRTSETIAVDKIEAEGKVSWRDQTGQTIETSKVEDLLSKLSNVQAQSFEAASHPSLKTPLLTVTVRFDDKKIETVTFAKAANDAFAARTDEPGGVRVATTPVDDVIKAVDDLK